MVVILVWLIYFCGFNFMLMKFNISIFICLDLT